MVEPFGSLECQFQHCSNGFEIASLNVPSKPQRTEQCACLHVSKLMLTLEAGKAINEVLDGAKHVDKCVLNSK